MEINTLAKKIKVLGGNLYLVGGAIRDEIMNKKSADEDYCITGLKKEDIEKIFPKEVINNLKFNVIKFEKKEFALARIDKKVKKGHKGFKIISNKDINIIDDLKRRDITINSIAKNVLTEDIIDPFNGIKDINNKILRATNLKEFCYDPLRIYRIARFSSTLDFKLDKKTLTVIKNTKSLRQEIKTISKSRIYEEIKKALLGIKPSNFFNVLKNTKLLDIHFKEIYDLIGAKQPKKYHPEGDSYVHTMITLDNTRKLTNDLKTIYGALVHDLGKGKTKKEMYPHHYNHDENR